MSEPVFRYDIVPVAVEDCPHCGADTNIVGECMARCQPSRAHKKDETCE